MADGPLVGQYCLKFFKFLKFLSFLSWSGRRRGQHGTMGGTAQPHKGNTAADDGATATGGTTAAHKGMRPANRPGPWRGPAT